MVAVEGEDSEWPAGWHKQEIHSSIQGMDRSPNIITRNEHSLTKRGVQTSKVKGLHELISVSGVIKCGLSQGCDEARQGRRKPTVGRCAEGRGISR